MPNGLILHGTTKMIKKLNHPDSRGFTLVEILLYIAIFGLVIGAVVGLSTLSITQRVKNQVMADTS